MFSRIQYISQGHTAQEQLHNIQAALDAGVTWIQLRFKHGSGPAVYALAETVKLHCAQYDATFIVNDWVRVAHATDADGVHLGLTDGPVQPARELLGTNKIIGGTANTLEDVRQRIAEACSYIGLGPFRFTQTKEKLSPVLGAAGYRQIISSLPDISSHVPVYAIGGITEHDADDLKATGVYGICLSAAITGAVDKRALVHTLYQKMYG